MVINAKKKIVLDPSLVGLIPSLERMGYTVTIAEISLAHEGEQPDYKIGDIEVIRIPPVTERKRQMEKYAWTDEMGEISGFGGGYEDACRAMVKAGCEYLDAHPDLNPKFHGYKNVTGLCMEDNDDAKALSTAITSVVGEDGCTGAMHQAAVSHCLFIRKNGWEKYVEEMTARKGVSQK